MSAAQLLDIRRLHEVSQVIAWKALSLDPEPGPYEPRDLDPIEDDDQEGAQQ